MADCDGSPSMYALSHNPIKQATLIINDIWVDK